MNPSVKPLNLTANGLVKTGNGGVTSVVLTAAGDTATAILYDNTAGSGTIILKLSAVQNTSVTANFTSPLGFTNGCYVVVSGTTPNVSVGTT